MKKSKQDQHEQLDRGQINDLINQKSIWFWWIVRIIFVGWFTTMVVIGTYTSIDYCIPKIQAYCNDSERIDCLEAGKHQWGNMIYNGWPDG